MNSYTWRYVVYPNRFGDPPPGFIVVATKNTNLDDDACRTIAETREYLDAVDELLARDATALDDVNAMLERRSTGWAGRSEATSPR